VTDEEVEVLSNGASPVVEPELLKSTKRKLQVTSPGDILLQGTEVPIRQPDLSSREICCFLGACFWDIVKKIQGTFAALGISPSYAFPLMIPPEVNWEVSCVTVGLKGQ